MPKNLKILFLSSTALFFIGIIILATRPVWGGNRVTLAALKDIVLARQVPHFSKFEIATTFLKLDLKERFGKKNKPQYCQIGEYNFEAQDLALAKWLLIDIFGRQDYYFPYKAPNPFIIDCGANIGFSVAYFVFRFPGAKILAFEPEPTNFSLLQKNLSHPMFKNVELHKQAVGESAGEVSFSGNRATGHIVEKNNTGQSISVEAVRLSDFITEKVDILKMDIEGGESGVLRDLANTNKLRMIKNIIMEYHYTADNQNALGESLALLTRHGFNYQIKSISGMSQPFNSSTDVRQRLNCLMIYAYQKA